jgi:predicted XRE-type DNA-binding protein
MSRVNSPEFLEMIIDLRRQGKTHPEITSLLGVTQNQVSHALRSKKRTKFESPFGPQPLPSTQPAVVSPPPPPPVNLGGSKNPVDLLDRIKTLWNEGASMQEVRGAISADRGSLAHSLLLLMLSGPRAQNRPDWLGGHILALSAQGLDQREIALKLRISHSSVYKALKTRKKAADRGKV